MNVLSLFDGCSCGQLALSGSGIKVDKYYASEIDKYAIKVTQSNFPNTIQLGDINNWREWDIEWSSIDLLIGGSPCQGFSFAGKQLLFGDPRSELFFVYVDILNHIKSVNPDVKFMLENVQMKEIALNTISYYLGVEPVFIDSAKVSAQSRKRWYWANWQIEQPEDRGIMLADIIESGEVDREKSYCIDANYFKGGSLNNYLEKSRRQVVLGCAKRGRHNGNKTEQKTEVRQDGKANALTLTEKTSRVAILQNPHGYNKGGVIQSGKCTSITSSSWQENNKLIFSQSENRLQVKEGEDLVRKLTVKECYRLQGLPDDYCKSVSNTQAYKMIGNGWQVDTIIHIFKQMDKPLKGQIRLF